MLLATDHMRNAPRTVGSWPAVEKLLQVATQTDVLGNRKCIRNVVRLFAGFHDCWNSD
jgi:hypothetical protein